MKLAVNAVTIFIFVLFLPVGARTGATGAGGTGTPLPSYYPNSQHLLQISYFSQFSVLQVLSSGNVFPMNV